MKTKSTNKKSKVIAVLAVICTLTFTSKLNAQNRSIGVEVKNVNSGAGLGSVLSPQLSLKSGSHSLQLGINLQKKRMNFAGFRAGYNFILNPGHNNEVFLFYDGAYLNNAYLSGRTVKIESRIRPENSGQYAAIRLNAVEHHLGFGMTFFKTGPVNLFGAIGAGFYHTLNNKYSQLFINRDDIASSVMLNLGISFKIYQ